jgi:HEAT repeat protein
MKLIIQKALVSALLFLLVANGIARSAESNRDQAWGILQANVDEKSTDKRAQAIRVLGLLQGDLRAEKLVDAAATDEKGDVRESAASSLGLLHGKGYVALLRKLVDDQEPAVALTAASALVASKDPEAYEAYYEFLTGERKATRGLIAAQMKTLRDPKKMTIIGIEGGLGFVPFAGIGVTAYKNLRVDDASPVRATAARMLANDPDPESGKALVTAATTDKSWLVRAAALEAIARRGDPRLIDDIVPAMADENTAVRCTAAAAVVRLSTIAEHKGTATKKPTAAKENVAPATSEPAGK